MSRAPMLRVPKPRWAAQVLAPDVSRPLRRAMRGPPDAESRSSGAIRVSPPEPPWHVRFERPGGGPGQGGPQQRDPQPGVQQQSDSRPVRTQGMPPRPCPEASRPQVRARLPAPVVIARTSPPVACNDGPISAAAAGRALRSGAARPRRYSRTGRSSIAVRYSMNVPGCCPKVDSLPYQPVFPASRKYRHPLRYRAVRCFP